MTVPSWQDKKFGSKVRGALWLETQVGEGNIFTKGDLRAAFPDVAQIDRRLRDLRDDGWRIDTSREDPGLRQDEQRYVQRGARVWIPGQSRPKKGASLTDGERRRTFQHDHYLCRSCGIGAGEEYGDGGRTAQLDIARREVRLQEGAVEVQLITECNRCRVGNGTREVDLQRVLGDIEALSSMERDIFRGWIKAEIRTQAPLEKLWGQLRALPADSRAIVERATGKEDQ